METTCACCGQNLLVHLPLPEFVQCDRCKEEWEEVSRQNIAFDEEQDRPCQASYYRSLRQHIRRLRSHSPTHYDVLWYQASLGIEPYEVYVVRRRDPWKGWEEVPRGHRPSGRVCGIYLEVVGPLGKLP